MAITLILSSEVSLTEQKDRVRGKTRGKGRREMKSSMKRKQDGANGNVWIDIIKSF